MTTLPGADKTLYMLRVGFRVRLVRSAKSNSHFSLYSFGILNGHNLYSEPLWHQIHHLYSTWQLPKPYSAAPYRQEEPRAWGPPSQTHKVTVVLQRVTGIGIYQAAPLACCPPTCKDACWMLLWAPGQLGWPPHSHHITHFKLLHRHAVITQGQLLPCWVPAPDCSDGCHAGPMSINNTVLGSCRTANLPSAHSMPSLQLV
jgi:hypothetical protein